MRLKMMLASYSYGDEPAAEKSVESVLSVG